VRYELFPEDRAREDYWIDEKGLIHCRKTINYAPEINENLRRQKDPQKGFTKGRTMQHLASVPPAVWHAYAKKVGYYEMDWEQKKIAKYRFLNDHPEWRVVERLVTKTASDGYVVVK
jgi:hypothetical protein